MIDEGIRTLFLAEGTITALLGSSTAGVYVSYAPQTVTRPYVEIHVISDDPMVVTTGTTGLATTELDIVCRAENSVDASDLAEAIAAYFDDFTGAAGSDTIKAVIRQDRIIGVETPLSGKGDPIAVDSLSYLVQWQ